MEKEAYVREVIRLLKRRYRTEMHTFLEFANPWELLVATVLSAQSQDAQVNRITRKLFKRHFAIEAYAKLRPQQLYPLIGSIGLYRNKAKSIVGAAKTILSDFGGKVPASIELLTTLPGVGRKTANVVLTNAFGIVEGIAIDTHCVVVSNRLGLVRTRNPEKIERRLMQLVPRRDWGDINHLFIALGRDVCTARRKYCSDCTLRHICPSSDAK